MTRSLLSVRRLQSIDGDAPHCAQHTALLLYSCISSHPATPHAPLSPPGNHPSQRFVIPIPRKIMAPLAPRSSGHEDQGISPELMIAIGGLFAVFFLVILVGFCLPAPADRRPDQQRAHASPGCSHRRLGPAPRGGLALPVASLPRCPACQNAHSASEKASRAPQESIRPPAAPPSPNVNVNTRRHAPTGGVSRLSSQSQRSGVPPFATAQLTAISLAPPPGRMSMSMVYGARGPTATLRPAVW